MLSVHNLEFWSHKVSTILVNILILYPTFAVVSCLKTSSMAGLELTMTIRLILNSQRLTFLILLSSRIKAMGYHSWPTQLLFLSSSVSKSGYPKFKRYDELVWDISYVLFDHPFLLFCYDMDLVEAVVLCTIEAYCLIVVCWWDCLILFGIMTQCRTALACSHHFQVIH